MESNGVIDQVIDDLWIDIFQFCSVSDFCHIRETCKTFHRVAKNADNPRINQYWERLSKQLCDYLEPRYQTTQWENIYWELRHLFKQHGYITKVDDKTHEIIEPKPPIHLTRYRKDMQNYKLTNQDNVSEDKTEAEEEEEKHDDIPPMFQFCIYGCVELLKMEFYKKCMSQLRSSQQVAIESQKNATTDDHDDISHCQHVEYKSVKDFDDEIISNVINYREALMDKGMKQYCPLYAATRFGCLNIVQFLLSTFPNIINIHNTNGLKRCALFMACIGGHNEIVKLLLGHPSMTVSHVNQQDQQGFTPLFVAAHDGKLELVKLLIENGGDINLDLAPKTAHTPFSIACFKGKYDVIKYCIESNEITINYNSCGMKNAPLFSLSEQNHFKCLELVLKTGKCDVNQLNRTQATPLWVASSKGSLESMKLLIEYGAIINQPDREVR